MTTPTHDLAIARAERDAWQSTCEELHRAIAGANVEIEAHLGRCEAADQRARSLDAALTAEREASKGLVAQVEALRAERAAIARAEKAERETRQERDRLRAEVAELTVTRDRLLAREHEDGRLHAQLRAEVDKLRARPVLTEERLDAAMTSVGYSAAVLPGIAAQLFKQLGAVTLPSPDRAEELAAAFMNERAARGKFMTWAELTDADRAKMTDAARVALASLGAPPTSRDTVRDAMERAAERFGGPDGVFSGAGFSNALMHAAGLSGAVDGRLVRAILAGRCDVQDRGNGHYQIAPSPTSPPAARPVFAAVSDEDLGRAVWSKYNNADPAAWPNITIGVRAMWTAAARAVRAKLGAAEVTEEHIKIALARLDAVTSNDDLTNDQLRGNRATLLMTYLREAVAQKDG